MNYEGQKTKTTAQSMRDRYKIMAEIVARYASDSGDEATTIPGLFLSKKVALDSPRYLAQWPCIALVVQGEKSVTLGQQVFHYGVGDYLLISLDLPVISQITAASASKPNLGIGMEINPVTLDRLLNRIAVPAQALRTGEMKSIAVNKAPVELVEATLRLMQLLDRPEDIEALAPLAQEEILYHVLTGPYGSQLLEFAKQDSTANRIVKAISWLREHYRETLKIKLLAEFVGMSESSLHEHFKAITLLTPMQYQKQLRLHEARKLMLLNRLDASEAGFLVGYQSPAQFSREYARLYGESPLRDVTKLRLRGSQ